MPIEWTIREYPHGKAIFGSIPVDDFSGLLKVWEKQGLTQISGGIADAIGASFVAVSPESGDAWMAELAKSGDWLRGGDTGLSSKTIYGVMTGHPARHPSVPYDPDDFGRCYRLLKLHPEWVERMPEVASQYPEWTALVREWAKLTALFEEELPSGKAPKLYAAMTALIAESSFRLVPFDEVKP